MVLGIINVQEATNNKKKKKICGQLLISIPVDLFHLAVLDRTLCLDTTKSSNPKSQLMRLDVNPVQCSTWSINGAPPPW